MQLDDEELSADRLELSGAVTSAVEISTTGPRGGDAGHGSRVVLLLENNGGSWDVKIDGEVSEAPSIVEITVRGDSEGLNLLHALEFAGMRLRQRWGDLVP